MKTEQQNDPTTPVFLQNVSAAVRKLKQKLQHNYEQVYPDLRDIIHLVLDEEEARAWELSSFPHLLFSDLVEAHVATLGLQPADTKHHNVVIPHRFSPIPTYQPSLALCG